MSKAGIPRMQGDDYQAYWFWLQVCRLFFEHTKVSCVGYEVDEFKSFDDVVVKYSNPIPDGRGDSVLADYYQVKFHVTPAGAFTWQNLMDPKFISATKYSLLERYRDACRKAFAAKQKCRFYVLSPWQLHPQNELSEIISNNDGEIKIDKLFDNTGPKSKMGIIRSSWCKHMELNDERELLDLLIPLRIKHNPFDLQDLIKHLNIHLLQAGFKPVEEHKHGSNPTNDTKVP